MHKYICNLYINTERERERERDRDREREKEKHIQTGQIALVEDS